MCEAGMDIIYLGMTLKNLKYQKMIIIIIIKIWIQLQHYDHIFFIIYFSLLYHPNLQIAGLCLSNQQNIHQLESHSLY